MTDRAPIPVKIDSLPDVRISSSSFHIYRTFREKAERPFYEMLRDQTAVKSIRLAKSTGQIAGILRLIRKPAITNDGRLDQQKVEVAIELVLGRILHFTQINLHIKMPVSAGVTLAERASGYSQKESLALLHQLVEMPEPMATIIQPRIKQWVYNHATSTLDAIYTDEYQRPIPMGHNRFFNKHP